jgi:ferredoxin-NADP reductase/CRP-like cAMP-binding protein
VSSEEALGLLRHAPPFDCLPPDALAALAEAATQTQAVPGQAIVREGEAGDTMYVVAVGSVQVIGKSFDGSEVVLARLEPGAYFGEQALLPGSTSRRSASVRALTHCRLLALTRASLRPVFELDGEFAQRMGATAKRHDELRASRLREGVLRKLGVAESHRIESFGSGEFVFREGDRADRFYLILQGHARVSTGAPGAQTELTELLPGQMFGELAILKEQPRTASVRAVDQLEVASMDAAWFRSNLAGSAQLQSIMQSMDGMYMLPRRGLLTLQIGQLASRPTLTAIHDLSDGRRVISTRLVGMPAFTSRVVGAPEPDLSVRFDDPHSGAVREVHLSDGVPVELESSGEWRELSDVFEMLLDAGRLDEGQIQRFEVHGSFKDEDRGGPRRRDGVVCACAGVSVDDIQQAMAAGCHTAEQLACRTRATRVCGGCLPTIEDMLGFARWTPARCASIVRLSEQVWAFRIKPLDRAITPFHPGQHLVIQGRIGELWVQRPYTISSAPGVGDAYEITVKREPQGACSGWLFARGADEGLLRISAPGGSFHWPTDGPVDAVCLVGGIGVTPALSMARALAHSPGRGRLHIDYSVSEPSQAIALDELRQIAMQASDMTLNIRSTRTQGRIGSAEIGRLAQARPSATFYLCGSDGYMATVAEHLAAAGVPPERVRQERFRVAGEQPLTAA